MDLSDIVIQRLEESGYSYTDITELLHKAFEERLSQGIIMSASKMSSNDVQEKAQSRIVLVAYRLTTNELIGIAMTQFRLDEDNLLFGDEEYKGIHPDYKRKGVGSLLEHALQDIAIESGASYLISTTALQAKSSIRYHLSNGFFKWCCISYPDTSYYSIVFRKQLIPHKKWDNVFYRNLHYYLSFCHTILTKRKDGTIRKR